MNVPVLGPDPVWTGVGNKYAWNAEFKPYRISCVLGATGIDGADAVLDCQPNPTEYNPAALKTLGGNGQPVRVGWASAVWNFKQLSIPQMDQLMAAYNLAYAQYNGFVYIVTRTNANELYTDSVSGWQEMRPVYQKFRAAFKGLSYELVGGWYKQVKAEFGHLTLV